MNKYKGKDMRAFIQSIPKDEFVRKNKEHHEAGLKRWKAFRTALKNNRCVHCGTLMNEFEPSKPCVHWLTYPTGIKKKHVLEFLNSPVLNFFGVQTYMRWLANSEHALRNINDLKDETSSNSFLEVTIRYKNIEWAFSVGETDLEGHENSKVGDVPHYHLQITENDRIVLRFNDCHIPFSDEDLMMIEIKKQMGNELKLEHIGGDGMESLSDEEFARLADEASIVTDDFENATFNTQTLVEGPEGGIPMETINKAIQESAQTKEPIRKILERLMPDLKQTTIISPGDGVPKMTKRSGKK